MKAICLNCGKSFYTKSSGSYQMCLKCTVATVNNKNKYLIDKNEELKKYNMVMLGDINNIFHNVLGIKKIYYIDETTKERKELDYTISSYESGNLYIIAIDKWKAPKHSKYNYHNVYYNLDFFQYNWEWGFIINGTK